MRKHSVALGKSDRSVRRILELDLEFHYFQMMMAHELSAADNVKCGNLCQQVLAQVPPVTEEEKVSPLWSCEQAEFVILG